MASDDVLRKIRSLLEKEGAAGTTPAEVAAAVARVDQQFALAKQFGEQRLGLKTQSTSTGRSDYGARLAGQRAGAGIYGSVKPALGSGGGLAKRLGAGGSK